METASEASEAEELGQELCHWIGIALGEASKKTGAFVRVSLPVSRLNELIAARFLHVGAVSCEDNRTASCSMRDTGGGASDVNQPAAPARPDQQQT